MKNIAFFMFPVKSHTFVALELANQFRQKGYNVIFFGEKIIKESVEQEGYFFHQISFIEEVRLSNWRALLGVLIKAFIDKRFVKDLYRSYIVSIDTWILVCKKYDIELAFIDDGLAEYYYILNKFVKKVFILNPRLSCSRFSGVPPINSGYVPKNLWVDTIYSNLLWSAYIFKRQFKRVVKRAVLLGIDENYLGFRYFKTKDLFSMKFFTDGYSFVSAPLNAKTIVLGPKALEYTFQKKKLMNFTSRFL